ncbi:baseplate J/gp47 family protein [Rubrivivax albus]|uniref:Baseplate protein J-like domain-containing protein n=1 Tax=Rubrivivax albus TaxID=2499835 RepID=A0A3S2TNF0_9BURK|nr:baseplate J/gp47 family protein [Rubrivivax albus]RVT48938.1 hypothetical protein ENE75_21555 [Rubrivivax albus]
MADTPASSPPTAAFLAQVAAPGTSRPDRDDPRRNPAYAPLDGRDTDGLLAALRALAARLHHVPSDPAAPAGNWLPFLPAGTVADLQAAGGGAAPHHALLLAFLRLLARPQALLDGFTGEHLQHQMQQVLGFRPMPARPDRVHLVLESKKGVAPWAVAPDHRFSAGKDEAGIEQLYAPVRETVVGAGHVERLASLWHDGPRLRFAPEADSADGLGEALPPERPRWAPFGHADLPAAPQGFAVASTLLRLSEGERSVQLKLRLGAWPAGQTAAGIAAAFDAWATGPEGWIGPLAVSGRREGDLLTLTVPLGAEQAAVIDHDPALHQHGYPAALPVLQLLLRDDADGRVLSGLSLRSVQVVVQAQGLRALLLENDEAVLDARKAFLPFGPQPVRGSRLHVGCAEALGKPLTALTLHLDWLGAPADLYAWYDGYARRGSLTGGVAARLTWQDSEGHVHAAGTHTLLPRHAAPVTLQVDPASPAPSATPQQRTAALHWSGSSAGRKTSAAAVAARPMAAISPRVAPRLAGRLGDRAGLRPGTPLPSGGGRAGFLTLTLEDDLLHADHLRDAMAAVTPPADPAGFVPKVLNPPYTPKLQSLVLDYSAQSDASALAEATEAAFTDTAVQFFHVDALGVAREHAWLTQQRPWAPPGPITLLPAHIEAGALMVGLSGVGPGDAVSLLLQAAEGSADPLAPAQAVTWSVLADDAWRTLGTAEGLLDTTNGLRTSGLLAVALPRETSTEHLRCPAGLVWLRATVAAAPRAACDLLGVHANAVEAVFVDQGNDPARLAAPLPPASVTKARSAMPGLQRVSQPYASFGGALAEDPAALARRAAERLRHRNRAVSSWDLEHLVLQAFPQVWRAKCVPHASDTSWLAPGHVSVIVLPDLHGTETPDPLQPRVDLDTLTRITAHLQARSAPQTQVHVRNPRYRPVQLAFKLRVRPGHGFNFAAAQVDLALRRALSPWAFDAPASLNFGGRVLRSALLAFVESLPEVDFVSDFRLVHEGQHDDRYEILPEAPDEILVSAPAHRIEELHDA